MVSSLQQGSRVLVTGATGYVGATVADQFIQAGYIVVGTSRSAHKAEAVKKYFDATYGPGKFEIYESDLEKEGAFDAAVKDVEAIAHVASPNVKSVVVTSSIVSVLNSEAEPGHIFTESDWNDVAYQTVLKLKESDQPIDAFLAYIASKNEAERALWRWKEEVKPAFALSTILPAFVYGAIIPTPQTVEAVNATSTPPMIINLFTGQNQDPSSSPVPEPSYVDVVDVGLMHVRAVELGKKVDGQRYLASAGVGSWQEALDIIHKNFPERKDIVAVGQPGSYKDFKHALDNSKAIRELGIKFNSFENVILNTVNSVKHLYKL
ncbi:unnamed protein product [Umbelopsis vinacea]